MAVNREEYKSESIFFSVTLLGLFMMAAAVLPNRRFLGRTGLAFVGVP